MNHYEKNPNPRVEQYDVVKVAVGRSRLRGGGRDLRRCAQLSAPRRSCHALISW